MPHIEATATVPLNTGAAFALAHEVGDERAAWDPSVAASRWLRGASGPREGAAVFTRSPGGRRRILRFELVVPGRLSSARLVKGQRLLADYGEGLRFEPTGDGTAITWKVTFKVASPLAQRAIGQLVQPRFERELDARMAALAAEARRRAGAAQAAGR